MPTMRSPSSRVSQTGLVPTACSLIPPTGTFNALSLYLIIFDTLSRKLRLQSRVPAHGPHQYLALSPGKGQLYATSWGVPAKLWSWAIEEQAGTVSLRETGSVPISECGGRGGDSERA